MVCSAEVVLRKNFEKRLNIFISKMNGPAGNRLK